MCGALDTPQPCIERQKTEHRGGWRQLQVGDALGRLADGGRMVAVKLKRPPDLTVALVALKVTIGLACTIVCMTEPGGSHGQNGTVSKILYRTLLARCNTLMRRLSSGRNETSVCTRCDDCLHTESGMTRTPALILARGARLQSLDSAPSLGERGLMADLEADGPAGTRDGSICSQSVPRESDAKTAEGTRRGTAR